MEFTIDELKLLHAAGVPIQIRAGRAEWDLRPRPDWSATAACYRPDPAAKIFRSPEGVLTLGHSREQLLAAQAAGWNLHGFHPARITWSDLKGGYAITNPRQLYRLAPGQEPWPAPEAKPKAADPWAREKRALAAGLRVQCGAQGGWERLKPLSTIGLGLAAGSAARKYPSWSFRVDPLDEPALQAIERREGINYPMPPEPPAQPINTATNTDYEAWLAARPARLAARKPIAVGTARFNAFRDMAGWTSQYKGPVDGLLLRKQVDRFPVHNPDARMATVLGHEKVMP